MQRVLIIGNAGSGKSTLGRRIARIRGIPAVHLDQLFWRPGWVETPDPEFRQAIEAAAAGPAWVMDGNYSRTFDIRLPVADTVVWLDFPRWLCVWRASRRWIAYRGRVRPDMPDGCAEKFDIAFLKWIWDYPNRSRAATLSVLKRIGTTKQVFVLKNPSEVRRFLETLERAPSAIAAGRESSAKDD